MILRIIFFLLFIFVLPSYSEEENNIVVKQYENSTIFESNISKFILSDPSLVEAKISNDKNSINIRGITQGNTILYIWSNNEIKIHTISIETKEINTKSQAYIEKSEQLYKNNPKGSYGADLNLSLSKLKSIQNLNTFINYDIPIEDKQSLSIKGSFLSGSDNFNTINTINLNNMTLSYKSPFFNFDLGDVNSNTQNNGLNIINPNVKGLKANIKPDNHELDFILGKEYTPLEFYNNTNNINQKNNLITGFYDNYNFSKDLNIRTSLYSKYNWDKSNLLSNLLSGFRYQISKDGSNYIESYFGTNFNSIGVSGTAQYKTNWDKTQEYVTTRISAINLGANFQSENSIKQSNYNISVTGHHRSEINISAFLGLNNYIDNNIETGFGLERYIIKDKINIYSGFSNRKSYYSDLNNFYLGSNINYIFPSTFNYRYIKNSLNRNIDTNEAELRSQIFRDKNTRIDLVSLYRRIISKNISDNSIRIGLSSYHNLFDILPISLGLNYIKNERFDSSNIFTQSFLDINSSFRIKIFDNYINIAINNQNSLDSKDSSITSFNLNYSTQIGGISDQDFKGDIKGFVFEDLNGNNILDDKDKIFDVPVFMNNTKTMSNHNGYKFDNLDYNYYKLLIDSKKLPEGYSVKDSPIREINLNDKEKIVNFIIIPKSILKGSIFSTKKGLLPLKDIKVFASNEKSIFEVKTNDIGEFYFELEKGSYDIKLDLSSIPKNYRVEAKYIKKINIPNKDELDFYILPIISLEATVTNGENIINDEELTINYYDDEKLIKTEVVKTDNEGKFYLFDLEHGMIIIKSPKLKKDTVIEIPETPRDINIEIKLDSKNLS